MEEDDKDKYFYCLNYGNKIYEEDVEKTDKYWNDDGNHLMIYTCSLCNYDNYET